MNKNIIRRLFLITSATVTIVGQIWSSPATAAANKFNQLFSFGDSFSDPRNFFNLTGFPPEPYFEGRFSNGPIWTDYVAEYLNLNPIPITEYETLPEPPKLNQVDGINFAFGGAESGFGGPEIGIETGTLKQVEIFTDIVSQSGPKGNPLFTLFVGGNDYLGVANSGMLPDTAETEAIYTQTVDNIVEVLTTLADDKANKAKNIVVFDMPDLNLIPLSNLFYDEPQKNFLDDVVMGHNNYLNNKLQEVTKLFDKTEFYLFSLNSLFQDVISSPNNFNFTNVTEGCLVTPFCSDPNDYLFWDSTHLTTAAHQILADSVLSALNLIDGNTNFAPTSNLPLYSIPFDSIHFNTLGPGSIVHVKNEMVSTPESNSILGLIILGFLSCTSVFSIKTKKGKGYKDYEKFKKIA